MPLCRGKQFGEVRGVECVGKGEGAGQQKVGSSRSRKEMHESTTLDGYRRCYILDLEHVPWIGGIPEGFVAI